MPDWLLWTLAVVSAAAVIYCVCCLAHGWREACGREDDE